MQSPDAVLDFWFREAGAKRWFKQSDAFDDLCRERFLTTLQGARLGECWEWRSSPAGRCAEIIVLDQFSRNLFRSDSRAYAQDGMALVLAQESVARGDDLRMTGDQRYFSYMPYMHSESPAVHKAGIALFEALGNEEALRYARAHQKVIEEFGRYPSRNADLGRVSTAAEKTYLANRRGW
ncbi:DUF924 family protein [Congregibacter litoralis]|uniref:DUF924 domain-containing protein n=1 Tax=Congregibacter litoralis KT71 TaxID=314285 RepID=A4A5S9_9GAMM|nr:DUF924 family protein [Congregibacter litoralis]EAQ98376.1 hypothetical protein KT71_00325 [Congregibacter litoralis KT71]